jgi:hypothetical protein
MSLQAVHTHASEVFALKSTHKSRTPLLPAASLVSRHKMADFLSLISVMQMSPFAPPE